jgi:hypothetical protein
MVTIILELQLLIIILQVYIKNLENTNLQYKVIRKIFNYYYCFMQIKIIQ